MTNVKQPDYYKKNGLSPIDSMKQGLVSHDEYLGFLKGNVIKYVVRCGKKEDALSDIDKAMHYLLMLRDEFVE